MSIAIGSRVRVAPRRELEAALRRTNPGPAPAPRQFLFAGREARVTAVRLDGREPLYELEGAPGLWREAWLRPA